jgi:hypothetical protein
LPVFLHIEAHGEPVDAGDDVVVVAPEFSLLRKPQLALGRTPGNALGADRVRIQRDVLAACAGFSSGFISRR